MRFDLPLTAIIEAKDQAHANAIAQKIQNLLRNDLTRVMIAGQAGTTIYTMKVGAPIPK